MPLEIDLFNLVSRCNELAASWKVRAFDVFHQLRDRRLRIVDQVDNSTRNLTQIVWRNIRGQTDGDTGRAVEQQVWQPGWQYDRFFHRAVEIRRPVDGAITEFGEQAPGIRHKTRFGVSHGGK